MLVFPRANGQLILTVVSGIIKKYEKWLDKIANLFSVQNLNFIFIQNDKFEPIWLPFRKMGTKFHLHFVNSALNNRRTNSVSPCHSSLSSSFNLNFLLLYQLKFNFQSDKIFNRKMSTAKKMFNRLFDIMALWLLRSLHRSYRVVLQLGSISEFRTTSWCQTQRAKKNKKYVYRRSEPGLVRPKTSVLTTTLSSLFGIAFLYYLRSFE